MNPRSVRPRAHAPALGLLLGLLACVLSACGHEADTVARGPAPGSVPVDHAITVDYPLDGSIFPPEIIPPLFLWHDAAPGVDRWRIHVAFGDGAAALEAISRGVPPPAGEIDPDAVGPTNELYVPTPYQASARSWRPDAALWETLKQRSVKAPAEVTIEGFRGSAPDAILSRGTLRIHTSKDPVGAPIFYRDVPLMPVRGEKGRIKPLGPNAIPLIAWRLRDVGRTGSRLMLSSMPTCANCHSFSADGSTMGMDVDGPDGDKGAYAMVPLEARTQIRPEHVLTWNDFADKPKGHRTIGFLSRVSPDGRYALTTLNEEVYIANFLDYRFLQVFYPTRGILGLYDRSSGEIRSMPGANDPAYVHCDPVWTPDGKTIVFARATAKDAYEADRPLATKPNDPNETQIRYDLMRMPFDEGRGGTAVSVAGAAANGMSNTFPKVSPDGRWIVFVKCRNGQLMRPDGRLWIVPLEGGAAREMNCNLPVMNSWHSFSPNGRWLVFSSKSHTPYTQMFLTHLDEEGNDSPAILIEGATAANRAVNIPEFVNIPYEDFQSVEVPAVSHYVDVQRGVDLLEAGNFDGALAAFERVLQTNPDFSRAHVHVGRLLAQRGRLDDAVRHYRRALASNPQGPMAHVNLGFALALKGDAPGAIRSYEEALRLDPLHALAHNNLGSALLQMDRDAQALPHLEKAVAGDPKLVLARKNLGFALLRADRLEEAATQYQAALDLASDDVVALASLSRIRLLQGRPVESVEFLRRVVELDGKDLHSIRVLAWHRATSPEADVRDGARAVELAKRAIVLQGRRTALLLDILAAAQAEAGDTAAAVKTAEEALTLATAREKRLVTGIRKRLDLYRAGKPYRGTTPSAAGG